MLRHPVRELAKGSVRRIDVPATYSVVDPRGVHALELLGVLMEQKAIGPPPSSFIAPLVEYAQDNGVFEAFVDDGVFVAPERTPFELLRFAALAMLHGPDEHVPYGWTHCLTLAQAPLLIAGSCTDPGQAAFVSLAYLAAHWAGLGSDTVENWFSPRAVEASVDEALDRLTDRRRRRRMAYGRPGAHAHVTRHLGVALPRRPPGQVHARLSRRGDR